MINTESAQPLVSSLEEIESAEIPRDVPEAGIARKEGALQAHLFFEKDLCVIIFGGKTDAADTDFFWTWFGKKPKAEFKPRRYVVSIESLAEAKSKMIAFLYALHSDMEKAGTGPLRVAHGSNTPIKKAVADVTKIFAGGTNYQFGESLKAILKTMRASQELIDNAEAERRRFAFKYERAQSMAGYARCAPDYWFITQAHGVDYPHTRLAMITGAYRQHSRKMVLGVSRSSFFLQTRRSTSHPPFSFFQAASCTEQWYTGFGRRRWKKSAS